MTNDDQSSHGRGLILGFRTDQSNRWLTYTEEWNLSDDPSEAIKCGNSATAEVMMTRAFQWACCRAEYASENKNIKPPKLVCFIGRQTDSWDEFKPIIRLLFKPEPCADNGKWYASVSREQKASGLRFGHEHIF